MIGSCFTYRLDTIYLLDTINPFCVLPPAYEQRYIFMYFYAFFDNWWFPTDWWILAHRSGSLISRFCWSFCRLNEHARKDTFCVLHQKFFKFVKMQPKLFLIKILKLFVQNWTPNLREKSLNSINYGKKSQFSASFSNHSKRFIECFNW